jgi:hypothetical protein
MPVSLSFMIDCEGKKTQHSQIMGIIIKMEKDEIHGKKMKDEK